ncbi:outer membrane insertion C- signal [Algoriphagus antarcticus]|uniref:Outer membrane insertion C-signal n=1 Tax=Algoriphagus antarcticus TaxID=238540 RepID=A0A3E0DEG0_9BACT|nr:outer membrane insertion C- signal [Algoriphagus antarcticus]REG81069.1 hypothetical protein C8N25_12914 [Algoriphagus antarcticus]
MKYLKIISLVLFFGLAAAHESNAQEVGIRFGNFYGNNVAIDGVFGLGQFSRIHADLSFGGNGVGLDALWNPIYRPVSTSDFNYYLGFGPSFYFGDPFAFGVAGEIGIEYAFEEVPIVIGLDWRPNLRIVENTDFLADQFGLNIRWRFGNDGSSSTN